MTEAIFGMSITRVDTEPRPASKSDMSVVGFVGTAPDADAQAFPLNTPVLMNSDDAVKLLALGDTGSLAGQFDLINSQLGELQVAARVVVVRVDAGADDDETITNLVGNAGLKTGIHALLTAGQALGVTPRLIGVPGFTYQRDTGVSAIAVTQGGTGYVANDPITAAGTGTGFVGKVLTVDAETGAILTVEITSGGNGYGDQTTLSVTSAAGEGATLTPTVEDLANPVCAALPAVCNALLAHAVVSGPHNTLQGYTDWRETLASDRLIPVETWAKAGTAPTTLDSVGTVIGIGVRRDYEKGGLPFWSWANQPVYGIVGPNRFLGFSLTDGASEAQQILALNGGVIVRGEAGVDTAIADGGFIYIGTDNAGNDALWQFYNVTRGRDYIHLMMLRTFRYYLGRFNISGQTIEAILQSGRSMLRDLQAQGAILGFDFNFLRDQNSPDNLRLGRFKLSFAAEEAPVLRFLGVSSARYRPALDALLDDLVAQLDIAA